MTSDKMIHLIENEIICNVLMLKHELVTFYVNCHSYIQPKWNYMISLLYEFDKNKNTFSVCWGRKQAFFESTFTSIFYHSRR